MQDFETVWEVSHATFFSSNFCVWVFHKQRCYNDFRNIQTVGHGALWKRKMLLLNNHKQFWINSSNVMILLRWQLSMDLNLQLTELGSLYSNNRVTSLLHRNGFTSSHQWLNQNNDRTGQGRIKHLTPCSKPLSVRNFWYLNLLYRYHSI